MENLRKDDLTKDYATLVEENKRLRNELWGFKAFAVIVLIIQVYNLIMK